MSLNDINRMWVLDLACMKHCGKQLPTLTLVHVFNYVQEAQKRTTPRKPKLPRCPEGTQDIVSLVVKGARKKKWSLRREHRQCATQYRMRRALRYSI